MSRALAPAAITRCAFDSRVKSIMASMIGAVHATGLGSTICSPRIGEVSCGLSVRVRAHVEFEHPGNHDDRLWSAAVLEQGEFERLLAVDEEPAAQALLILDHPVAVAVAADEEQRRLGA